MFTEEQIKAAADLYFIGLLPQMEIRARLGYPSQLSLSRWVRQNSRYGVLHAREKKPEIAKRSNVKYPYDVRVKAVKMAEEEHLSRREVAQRLGLCGAPMVTKWVKIAQERGYETLMTRQDRKRMRNGIRTDSPPDDIDKLKRQNAELRLDNAILEETVDILKRPRHRSAGPLQQGKDDCDRCDEGQGA